jgi:hypothetical protein
VVRIRAPAPSGWPRHAPLFTLTDRDPIPDLRSPPGFARQSLIQPDQSQVIDGKPARWAPLWVAESVRTHTRGNAAAADATSAIDAAGRRLPAPRSRSHSGRRHQPDELPAVTDPPSLRMRASSAE